MEPLIQSWAWVLADWSVRWFVLILGFLAVLPLMRSARPHARYRLCRVVLIVGLFLPLLPHWQIGFTLTNPIQSSSQSTWQVPVDSPSPIKSSSDSDVVSTHSGILTSTSSVDFPWRHRFSWFQVGLSILAFVWVAGVGLGLIRLIWCWRTTWRLRVNSLVVDKKHVQELISVCQWIGLKRAVRMAFHPDVPSPIVLGGWRPWLLVPSHWEDLSEEERQACLFHELEHLRQWDDFWLVIQELAHCLFFFHPLVLVLVRRLGFERECVCDQAAVQGGIEPTRFARLLLRFHKQTQDGSNQKYVIALPLFGQSLLKKRIQCLLETTPMQSNSTPSSNSAPQTILTIVSLIIALAVGGFGLRAQERSTSQTTPAPAFIPEPITKTKVVQVRVVSESEIWVDDRKLDSIDKLAKLDFGGANPVEVQLQAGADVSFTAIRKILDVIKSNKISLSTYEKNMPDKASASKLNLESVSQETESEIYQQLGIKVVPVPASDLKPANVGGNLRGGLKIVDVAPDSVCAKAQILKDDILVGMRLDQLSWETLQTTDLVYIIKHYKTLMRRQIDVQISLKFYLIRSNKTIAGVIHFQPDPIRNKTDQTGRIEGQVLAGELPVPHMIVVAQKAHEQSIYGGGALSDFDKPEMAARLQKTETDDQGLFMFESIAPGQVRLNLAFVDKDRWELVSSIEVVVEVKPKRTAFATLGGQGQTVIGKLKKPESGSFSTLKVSIYPAAPPFSLIQPGETPPGFMAYGKLHDSPLGKQYWQDQITVNSDGQFTIKGVPIGRYHIQIHDPQSKTVRGNSFDVVASPKVKPEKTLDLGLIP